MSDPVSGTSIIVAGGLMGAGMFGLVTGIDYGVVFGAFAGAVFYVATAVNITRFRLAAYFMTSFIVGVLGSGLIGTTLAIWIGYNERPLDALGAVLISALIIKILTFLNNQELTDLYKILTRNSSGRPNGK
ncbi:phage holin family protein [Klebsiella michiganensis]|uniref:phage holin family protein n=1 Tax=Klebsiella michiganensis TaxID=1134687 RepID=UPI0023A9D02E|nr:phage holin family protein [Klebsiella michiganensis]MDD9643165.1 phage holin family protein [Klebsiella michiganensis]